MKLRFASRGEQLSSRGPWAVSEWRRGLAATELAVLAPFLAALLMGMCEMGRAVMVKDILTDASRKGCRTGATPKKTFQNILDDVNNILSDNHISTANATITIQTAPTRETQQPRVGVRLPPLVRVALLQARWTRSP